MFLSVTEHPTQLTSVSRGFQPTQRLFMHFDTSDQEKPSELKRNIFAM